ncbi:MAG: hypothetical protein KAR83_05635 [Thermodesulfovibrionales bacterium]|nr:hypothetical protein [Thermodesulfovibrionales bacterium]
MCRLEAYAISGVISEKHGQPGNFLNLAHVYTTLPCKLPTQGKGAHGPQATIYIFIIDLLVNYCYFNGSYAIVQALWKILIREMDIK